MTQRSAIDATIPSACLPVKPKTGSDAWMMRVGLLVIGLYLLLGVVWPLWALLQKSFQDTEGSWVGLANFEAYFAEPALAQSIGNSLFIATTASLVTLVLAFGYAYALTRSAMPFKTTFKTLASIPLLMPSLLPAIALIYLFGNQGLITNMLLGMESGESFIYGPVGIIMGEVFFAFPHAFLIIYIALSTADARLFEAADVLRSSSSRTFLNVTLPGAKYGLISAFFVAFTLIITDFGVPKVIGGQYNVLATDIYKQVVGRQDFQMGAVVGLLLLIPAVVAFVADRWVQAQKGSVGVSSKAVIYQPKKNRRFDTWMLVYCVVVATMLVGILLVAAAASLFTFWPYDLSLSLNNYQFDMFDGGGWEAFWNSIRMAFYTAIFGTALIFLGAYFVEKTPGSLLGRTALHLLAMLPLAVPGLVLGLAYVFFFNTPDNPLGFLYATMAILVISTISHFYTVCHLSATTALKQMDPEFEAVSASMKVPAWKTFFKVTVPVATPALLDIFMYLFLNAMTTLSAVVFLYSPDTALASIAVLNMDDAGDIAPAAAMGMMIVYTAIIARVLHAVIAHFIVKRTQTWRGR